MTLTRITSALGAVVLGGVLVASSYDAHAAGPPAAPTHAHHGRAHAPDRFQAPAPHKYGSNGMRMGLHCETSEVA